MFYFFSVNYDDILGSCYDTAFGRSAGQTVASGPDPERKKRAFDDLVDTEARRLQAVEQVIALYAAKNAFWSEKIFAELVATREQMSAAQRENAELLSDLKWTVNATATQFREYFLYDLILFQRDYWFNETNMGELTFKSWIWNQTPIGSLFSGSAAILTLLFKFSDDRIASLLAKARKLSLAGWQKVLICDRLNRLI